MVCSLREDPLPTVNVKGHSEVMKISIAHGAFTEQYLLIFAYHNAYQYL